MSSWRKKLEMEKILFQFYTLNKLEHVILIAEVDFTEYGCK